MLQIKNEGARIISTNYFESEQGRNDYMYLSANAGHLRLLMPGLSKSIIAGESRSALRKIKHVQIYRGMHPTHKRSMLKLIFEDKTDNPIVIEIAEEQCDLLPEESEGWVLDCVDAGLDVFFSRPAKVRKVEILPLRF